MERKEPVGVFLGSFDPPHIGHLGVVMDALQKRTGGYQKILVIPAYGNPWKSSQSSYEERFRMTQELFKDIPGIEVSGIEKDIYISEGIPPKSYSVIQELKKTYDHLEIITTPETFSEIPKWWKGEKILGTEKFLLVLTKIRGKISKSSYMRANEKVPSGNLEMIASEDFDVSSTKVRGLVEKGLIPYPWITPGVWRIIKEKSLYVH